jgi:serine/threonine-protein phosphatase PGAM5
MHRESGVASRFLYLIRHGQYDTSVRHQLGGSLTPLGRQQAEITAQALCDVPVNTIYCSSMRRAEETAEIIAQVFPAAMLQKTRSLWECVPTVPEKYAQHFSEAQIGGTSECRQQLDSAFNRFFKLARGGEKHELLICHGNVVRYLVCRALEVNLDAWANMHIYNCGISRVMIEPHGMFLISHNEINHIPLHLQTET